MNVENFKPAIVYTIYIAATPEKVWQALTTAALLLGVGFLVLLPVAFLVEESLNTGDPMAFPAEKFGIGNYLAIFDEDLHNEPRFAGPVTRWLTNLFAEGAAKTVAKATASS